LEFWIFDVAPGASSQKIVEAHPTRAFRKLAIRPHEIAARVAREPSLK
jgi:hypothetical protein